MKIIFKPTNKLVEKLTLDERLILDEADDFITSSDKLNDFAARQLVEETTKLQNIILETKETIDNISNKTVLSKQIEKNIQDIKKQINEIISETDVDKLKIVNNDFSNFNPTNYITKKANFANEINSLTSNLKLFIQKISYNGKDTDISILPKLVKEIDEADKNINKKFDNNTNSRVSNIEKENCKNSINKVRQNLFTIDKILTAALSDFSKQYKDFSLSRVIGYRENILAVPKSIKEFLNKFSLKSKEYTKIGSATKKEDIYKDISKVNSLQKDWEKQKNEINSVLANSKISVDELKIKYDRLIKSSQELLKNTDKDFSIINNLINKNISNFENKTKNNSFKNKSNYNWDNAFENIEENDDSAEQKAAEYDNLWKKYVSEYEPIKNIKDIESIYGKALKVETEKLGYTTETNPFITFIKKLNDNGINPGTRGYTTIHNIAAKDYSEDLEKFLNNDILYCKDLYLKNNSEIEWYIENYIKLSNKNNLDLSDKISEKYAGKEKNFVLDLFFVPGNVNEFEANNITQKTKNKKPIDLLTNGLPINLTLHSVSDINKAYKIATTNDLSSKTNVNNTIVDSIINKADNKDKAKKLAQLFLTKYQNILAEEEIKKYNSKFEIDNNTFLFNPKELNDFNKIVDKYKGFNENIIKDALNKLIEKFFK